MGLLQIRGNAVETCIHDTDGRCHLVVHLEIFNPSAREAVQIINHRRHYLSPAGWVEQEPWRSPDFCEVGTSLAPGERRAFDTMTPWSAGLALYVRVDVHVASGMRSGQATAQIPVVTGSPERTAARGVIADSRLQVAASPTVVVPDCARQTEAQARELITAAGLRVGSVVFRATLTGTMPRLDQPFAVIDQLPRPGTEATSGSTVNLTLARP